MLLLKDISTSQEHRKNSNYKALTRTTHVKAPPHVNMERTDRWHLCECGECGLPFPRGLPIVARLLVCPVSASFDHLSMSPRLVTRLCISASGGSSLPGLPARSVLSWKCWPLSLQPKFSYFWTKIMFASLPGTRSGCKHRDAPPGDYFNGILNTELPDLRLNAPNISHVTHQSKWRDLRTLIEKVFRFFLTNKPLTLKMWLPFRIVRFY